MHPETRTRPSFRCPSLPPYVPKVPCHGGLATMRIVLAVMSLVLLGGITTANAQQGRTPPSKPTIIFRDQDIFRAPPRSPATRPDPPPRPEIGRPRDRPEPLPEMKPR